MKTNKTVFLGFRATAEERQKIDALAARYNVTASEMLRLLVSVAETRIVARAEPSVPADFDAAIAAAKKGTP